MKVCDICQQKLGGGKVVFTLSVHIARGSRPTDEHAFDVVDTCSLEHYVLALVRTARSQALGSDGSAALLEQAREELAGRSKFEEPSR